MISPIVNWKSHLPDAVIRVLPWNQRIRRRRSRAESSAQLNTRARDGAHGTIVPRFQIAARPSCIHPRLSRRPWRAGAGCKEIYSMALRLHRSPPGVALALDGQKDLVERPCLTRLWSPVPQSSGILLAKFPTPLADGRVSHQDPTRHAPRVDIAASEAEPAIQPAPMTVDLFGVAVGLVAGRGVRRSHVARMPHGRGFQQIDKASTT